MDQQIDPYQVQMAKVLIDVVVMHCLKFPLPVIAAAFRQKLQELEQEATG